MLGAATELFLEKGFERTSLSDIVDRSKGSRSTLYEYFGNKEGLLRAMVEDAAAMVRQNVGIDSVAQGMTEAGLVELGVRFIRAVLAPDVVAVYRIVASEGRWVSGIAELFYQASVQEQKGRLSDWFRQARSSGGFKDISPDDLTRLFVGIVLADFHVRHTIGLDPTWDDDEIQRHTRLAVGIFLAGIRLPPD